jgi:hypothetical protein
MSQAEDSRPAAGPGGEKEVSVEDVRRLMGPSTPHFALQLRDRIAGLIAGLPEDHPARVEGAREIARLERLGFSGETRGQAGEAGERPLPSLEVAESQQARSEAARAQRPPEGPQPERPRPERR